MSIGPVKDVTMALLMSGQFTSKSIYDLMIWVCEGVSLSEIIQLMGS